MTSRLPSSAGHILCDKVISPMLGNDMLLVCASECSRLCWQVPTHTISALLLSRLLTLQNFMYAPMSAHLATHSFNDADSLGIPVMNGSTAPTSPTRSPASPRMSSASPRRSPASPTMAAQSPSKRVEFSQQQSPSYRRQSLDMPRHAYANGNTHSEAIPISPGTTVRRASFDLPRMYHPPVTAQPHLLSQRPSASWTSQGAAEAASSSHENAVSPSRAWYRQAQQQQPLYRQHSVRSSVSSLPDIDEQDSSFTSQSTEAPMERARARQLQPPALEVHIPPSLSHHHNGFSRSPSSLPDIEEQSNNSTSKPASPSMSSSALHPELQKAAVTAIHAGLKEVQAQDPESVPGQDNGDSIPAQGAVTVTDDSPLKIPLLDAADEGPTPAAAMASKGERALLTRPTPAHLHHPCSPAPTMLTHPTSAHPLYHTVRPAVTCVSSSSAF